MGNDEEDTLRLISPTTTLKATTGTTNYLKRTTKHFVESGKS